MLTLPLSIAQRQFVKIHSESNKVKLSKGWRKSGWRFGLVLGTREVGSSLGSSSSSSVYIKTG